MKKIQMIIAGVAALMVSGMVSADTLESGPNPYRMTDCGLLANDISIVLTSGVVGGVTCDDVTKNHVALSVCHTAGLTTDRSANVETCVDDGEGGETCTTAVETVTGSAYPSASTRRGTVSSNYPGTACADDGSSAETESAAVMSDL